MGAVIRNCLSLKMLRLSLVSLCLMLSGCLTMPQFSRQPQLHNPYPQLSKVAIAPFFNLTNEPTLDGRKVATAYFNELQSVPGYEVVPVGIVETAMRENNIDLRGASEARRLAQILKVDAIVIGAVTDYFPYYPPRMALQVEWYAANPGFHPIPAGYGLPWGTPDEKDIPAPLVFEAEMELAKAQLKTQTPAMPVAPIKEPKKDRGDSASDGSSMHLNPHGNASGEGLRIPDAPAVGEGLKIPDEPAVEGGNGSVKSLQHTVPVETDSAATADTVVTNSAIHVSGTSLPANWPDARGFIPPPPRPEPPPSIPSNAPVLRHTRTYNGHDLDFTAALSSYYANRDDARFGGWQNYLNRSDDFIRFCCHMHISEMLTARGGAGESRLTWRRINIR
jgi:hypothetical protein